MNPDYVVYWTIVGAIFLVLVAVIGIAIVVLLLQILRKIDGKTE